MAKTTTRRRRQTPARKHQCGAIDWQRVKQVGFVATVVLIMATLTLWLAGLSYHHPVMALRQVALPKQLTVDQKRQIAGKVKAYLGHSLLLISISQMKYELETLPWVRQAQIKRANTHRLDIALDTQKALAYWQNHGVINERLEVFEHIDLSRQLVHLDAPKAKLGDAAQQLRLISQDNNTGLMPQNLQWQPTGVWRLHFKNGLWVIMDGMHYVNELSRLLLSYDRLMAGKDPANYYIDARYPHGLALGLQHSATAKTS